MAVTNNPHVPAAAGQPTRYGEVYDRGYAHYDGPRLGRRHAMRALIGYSIKRSLGIKKSWTAKVIPIILYVGIALPVIVVIGIKAFLPSANVGGYAWFFGVGFLVEGIFVATITPEMLCGDRRENVLPLYFSRALTRLDYLLGKLAATAILTLTITLIPAFVLWLGTQLLANSPLSAMGHHLDDLGKIILAGVLLAFYLGSVGLMISSFTGRKAVAVGVIILSFLITEAIAGALTEVINHDYRKYVRLLSPTDTISNLVGQLFGTLSTDVRWLPLWSIVAWMMGVVVVCCFVMYLRYVPNE